MSAEIWRSELVLYGYMVLNLLAVGAALVWAYRRGLLGAPEDPLAAGFPPHGKETRHG